MPGTFIIWADQLTLVIMLADVLEDLDMARHLLARAYPSSLASDIVSDHLVTPARLAIDADLLSSKLGYETNGCITFDSSAMF